MLDIVRFVPPAVVGGVKMGAVRNTSRMALCPACAGMLLADLERKS